MLSYPLRVRGLKRGSGTLTRTLRLSYPLRVRGLKHDFNVLIVKHNFRRILYGYVG